MCGVVEANLIIFCFFFRWEIGWFCLINNILYFWQDKKWRRLPICGSPFAHGLHVYWIYVVQFTYTYKSLLRTSVRLFDVRNSCSCILWGLDGNSQMNVECLAIWTLITWGMSAANIFLVRIK